MKPANDVLYLVPAAADTRVRREMVAAGGQPEPVNGGAWIAVPGAQSTARMHLVHDVDEALRRIGEHYYGFVVADERHGDTSLGVRFLEAAHYTGDPEQRYPLSRVIVALPDDGRLGERAFRLGKLSAGGFVTDPFDGSLLELMGRLRDPAPGKTALCLSGGGVEGFLYELGVLRALNAHLQTRSVTDIDIFCGISAGAIASAFLANGIGPEEMGAAMTGDAEGAGVDPVTPAIIFDPDFKEYGARLLALARTLGRRSWGEAISSLLKAVPTGFFKGDGLRDYIARQLEVEGRTNDFRKLDCELYIGATEQDTSAHVVFGDGQWRDVPISDAVRASTALTPFFEPYEIRDHYFVDGQYTRTSNFHLAVERGARLVIVLNPLVPIRADEPGYVAAKGGIFSGLQALKAVIHTRFMHGYEHAVENNPNVDFILFQPEKQEMRLLSGSPMKYQIRTEILNAAYRSTVRRIKRDFDIFANIFDKHGLTLQRQPRLRGGHRPVF